MTLAPRARTFALLTGVVAAGGAAVAVGCVSSYHADDTRVGADGAADAVSADAVSADAGAEASACGENPQTDTKNCGRCNHDCLGGACTAGKCQAAELGAAPSSPLSYVVVSDQHVFAATRATRTTDAGGVWRIPKGGGTLELYVSLRYAQAMALLGDKLYFVVNDDAADGAGSTGGLYSCPLIGAAPCAPALIAAARRPASITVDQNRVLYGDDSPGKGLMAYTPGGTPTVFRASYGFSTNAFVDGEVALYTATLLTGLPRATLFEIVPDGGARERFAYQSSSAESGRLIGDATSLFVTAYDSSSTARGVVRRLRRSGGTDCDLGGADNVRPYGLYADPTRVYWTNQGMGAVQPYTSGSVASCERSGCCTTPEVMWTGNGQPTGVTGDAEAIYFVTQTAGGIWKIAKP